MIPWLEANAPFPAVDAALDEPSGLLAASERLSAARLVAAYRLGIFPWYGSGEPVLWWCPEPRMVLCTKEFHVSRSLRKVLRATAASSSREVRVDQDFEGVMRACAAPRPGQDGTWIDEAIIAAYGELARDGLAHSIEVRDEGRLVGGLYGVCLGRMFYGESMFSRAANTSKIALAGLVAILSREGVPVIDCQQRTRHLASLGGRTMTRRSFCAHVAVASSLAPVDWSRYRGTRLNDLLTDSD